MVAEHYLSELCFRSMLQVVERNSVGRPKTCKLHDLIRECAVSISKKEKFCASCHGKELKEVMKENGARRLSIQITEGEIESYTGMSQLRSFLVFSIDMSSLCLSNSFIAEFKLLRTLDLENVPIEKLPNGVVYLFNLRYLNLRGTAIKKLPKSIGRLRNLQTLNIRDTKIETLPKGIAKLLNLRHLIMYHYRDYDNIIGGRFRYVNGTRAPQNVTKLNKLQVLSRVEAEGDFIRLLGNMNQLTKIGITNVKKRDEMQLCDSIQKLQLLQNLSLMACDEEEILGMNALRSPSPHLRVVILAGKLEKVPLWFHSLRNLTCLHLHWSRLEDDLLPYIEALPCLGCLILVNSYVGKELCFSRGFVKLTKLYLMNFPLTDKMTIEKGVMPNLKYFNLANFVELKTLPLGLEFLTNLRQLELLNLPMEIIDPIRKGAVDRPKVQHIPEIIHLNNMQSSRGVIYEKLS